jgi:hypothetical protein
MQKSQRDDIPILARSAGQKFQGIAPERTEYAIKRAGFRTRRKFGGKLAVHLQMLSAADSGVNAPSFLVR